jgi:DNA-binding transcriptional LysR family regulator
MFNRLELLRTFSVAAESSSFREAAARLGISPQGVTRSIKELEQHFGELLFHRNTRQVRITAFGEQLALRARQTIEQVEVLFQHPGQPADTELSGQVRVTAPRSLGRLFIQSALHQVALQHPNIVMDLRLSDEIANVVDEQIDIGVRIGFLRDNRFVARPVGKVSFSIVASPELIARKGVPASLQALSELPTTALLDRSTGRAWPWYLGGGKQITPAMPAFLTDDPETERDAVLAGIAYGQLPDYLIAPHLRSGRLVTVLAEHEPTPWEVYVYRPQRGPVPARIRLVFDQIVAGMSNPATLRT